MYIVQVEGPPGIRSPKVSQMASIALTISSIPSTPSSSIPSMVPTMCLQIPQASTLVCLVSVELSNAVEEKNFKFSAHFDS